jgi:phosphoribosylformylglycinamidine cyclo-ligase
MQDSLIDSSLLVGEALLSPTRTYLPVIKSIMSEKGDSISGLVHCSGGGQTKCMRFGTNVHHIKDNLFSPPPLFQEIQRVSGTTDKEMHQVYNMGHRFEIYCKDEAIEEIIGISKSYNIEAQVIGRTEKSNKENSQNHLTIKTDKFQLTYG